MNSFEENYDEFIKDEIFIMQWINHLQFILVMQRKGIYKELSDNSNIFGKIMDILFEYNFIFEED